MAAASLDILLLSDSQASWHFVDKLVETENQIHQHAYDFVLVAGGLTSVDNQIGKDIDLEMQAQASLDHERTLELLEQLLSTDNSNSKVLFVPGSQDLPALFDQEQAVKQDSASKVLNLHKKTYLMAEGLLAVGLGGSVPAYFTHYVVAEGDESLPDDDLFDEFALMQEKVETINSYPYASEEEY